MTTFSDTLSKLESDFRKENASRIAEARHICSIYDLGFEIEDDSVVTKNDMERLRAIIKTFCGGVTQRGKDDDVLPPKKKKKQEEGIPIDQQTDDKRLHFLAILKHFSKDDLKLILGGVMDDDETSTRILSHTKKRQDIIDEITRQTDIKGLCGSMSQLRRDALTDIAGKMKVPQYGNKEALVARMMQNARNLCCSASPSDDDIKIL